MATFGEIISEARRAKKISQKDLAALVKNKDGKSIATQYMNDIERDRRNPPSEYLLRQFAQVLGLSKDYLCLAAGIVPEELRKLVVMFPDNVEAAFEVFYESVKNKR